MKNKKLLTVLLTASCMLTGAFVVTGCSEKSAEHQHEWNAGEQTTAPTCEEDGVKTYTCGVCQETKTEPVAKLGHEYGAWSVKTAPTASAEGSAERVCEHDQTHKESKTLPVLSETAYTVSVTKQASCTEKGATLYTLKEDDTIQVTVETDMVAHSANLSDKVVDGRHYARFECSVCGKALSDSFEYDEALIAGGTSTSAAELETVSKTYFGQINVNNNFYKIQFTEAGTYSFAVNNVKSDPLAYISAILVDNANGGRDNVMTRTGTVTTNYQNFCKVTEYVTIQGKNVSAAVTYSVTEEDVTAGKYIYFNITPMQAEKTSSAPSATNPAAFTFRVGIPEQGSAEKTLVYGENTVTITDTYLTADTTEDKYTYIPTTNGVQSITVPEGVVGMMVSVINGEDITILIDSAEGKCYANFNTAANVPIVFAFVAGVKGDILVTVGAEIEETQESPTISLTDSVIVTLGYKAPVEIKVAADLPEGEYTIALGLGPSGYRNAYGVRVNDGTVVTLEAVNNFQNKFTVKGGDIITVEPLGPGSAEATVSLTPVAASNVLGLGEEGAIIATFTTTKPGYDVYPELSADIVSGTYKITVTGVDAVNTAVVSVSAPGMSRKTLTNTDGVATETITIDFEKEPNASLYIRCVANVTLKIVLEKVEEPAA